MYCYLASNHIEYGLLSTYERSWICKIEKVNGKAMPEMQITDFLATSKEASIAYDKEYFSFHKLAFVLFSLMHTSQDSFKFDPNNVRIRNEILEQHEKEIENIDDQKKDPVFEPSSRIKLGNFSFRMA